MMEPVTWKDSWHDLWNFIDSLSCDTLSHWADSWQCPTVCVPAYGVWPGGLLVIQLLDGRRYGYPLTPHTGRADKLHSVRISAAQWEKWTHDWQAQQAAWVITLQRVQDFTARVSVFTAESLLDAETAQLRKENY